MATQTISIFKIKTWPQLDAKDFKLVVMEDWQLASNRNQAESIHL